VGRHRPRRLGAGRSGTGTASTRSLGGERIEEDYTLPCFVHVILDGSVQKPARDAAIALFDGIVRVVHADPTLGGISREGPVGLASPAVVDADAERRRHRGGDRDAATSSIDIHNTYIP
jgi:hypothetical protein